MKLSLVAKGQRQGDSLEMVNIPRKSQKAANVGSGLDMRTDFFIRL